MFHCVLYVPEFWCLDHFASFCCFDRSSMVKRFGRDFFWHWVGGVPWGEGAREDCWCDYDRSV